MFQKVSISFLLEQLCTQYAITIWHFVPCPLRDDGSLFIVFYSRERAKITDIRDSLHLCYWLYLIYKTLHCINICDTDRSTHIVYKNSGYMYHGNWLFNWYPSWLISLSTSSIFTRYFNLFYFHKVFQPPLFSQGISTSSVFTRYFNLLWYPSHNVFQHLVGYQSPLFPEISFLNCTCFDYSGRIPFYTYWQYIFRLDRTSLCQIDII